MKKRSKQQTEWLLISLLIGSLKPTPSSVGINGCVAVSLNDSDLAHRHDAKNDHRYFTMTFESDRSAVLVRKEIQ